MRSEPADRCDACGSNCSWADSNSFAHEMLIRKRWGGGRLLTALAYAVFAMVPIPLALWIAYGALVLMGPLGLVPGLLMGALVLGATLWMLMQSWRAAVDAWSSREVPKLMDHDPVA